jgi:3-deoxy-D-manno-octulosonic-acid transferase
MLHAVSVGEVNTLRALVPILQDRAIEVLVTTTTDTGMARATALWGSSASPAAPASSAPAAVFVRRYPLDFSASVARFLDAAQPDAVALVELEVWPNFLRACTRRAVPVCVINGRLSPRSFRGYSRFRPLLRGMFASLQSAAVQDDDYADRFRAMGVPPERVHVTGSMKWDSVSLPATSNPAPSPKAVALRDALGIDPARPLIVAGSTAPLTGGSHTTEEALLDAAAASLGEHVQLLCAPRKPEHRDAAFAALGGPPRCRRRSECPDGSRASASPAVNRYLLDTIGELRHAYELADLCVVGRSFGGLYGSDPIEPIALAKPTIIGPHHADFQGIVNAFARRDAIVIAPHERLPAAIRALLDDQAARESLATRGLDCIRAMQGATMRHADLLCGLLADRPM